MREELKTVEMIMNQDNSNKSSLDIESSDTELE